MTVPKTLWRYTKGILAALAVGFGVFGSILFIEVAPYLPDNLSVVVLLIGLGAVGFTGWKVSRPGQTETEKVVEGAV